jgi:dienelactone hydrolase
VWYPKESVVGGAEQQVAPGAFPLVLFSHGLTSSPEAYQGVANRIAAAGFVVVAPAYPFTNSAADPYNPADLINQPADASAVITALLALAATPADPLAGHIDASRVGVAGHSAGAYTTVGLLSGARDNRVRAAVVIAGGSLGGAFIGPAASVLFIHGDKDPVVSYPIGQATYELVPWPKAFLTVVDGDHGSYLYVPTPAAGAVWPTLLDFLRWTLYGDAAAKARMSLEATVNGATEFESAL